MNLKLHTNSIRYILFSLLLALPVALLGQTKLPKHKSDHWTTLVVNGGILRSGDYFIRLDEGYGSFTQFNFVDGLSVGPRMTFGKVFKDYTRLEISEDVKWAAARKSLMATASVKYVLHPQFCGFVEVFGGKKTTDYDRYPVITENTRSLCASIFGWNHPKLYEQTIFGASIYGALSNDFQLNVIAEWERREQMENHIWRSIFGKRPDDNTPYVQGEAMEDYGVDKIFRLDAQLDYIPGRKVYVKDDLTSSMDSDKPVFSLRATSGWNKGLRFLSLDLSVLGMLNGWTPSQKIVYKASVGFFPVRNKMLLMDMRHFDAYDVSGFGFQNGFVPSLCIVLDNYELSTSKSWIEAHADWSNTFFYGQVHFIKVPDMPAHEEFSGGIKLGDNIRVGCAVGFRDLKYNGIAGILIIQL